MPPGVAAITAYYTSRLLATLVKRANYTDVKDWGYALMLQLSPHQALLMWHQHQHDMLI